MPEKLIEKIHRLMESERQEHPQADEMMSYVFQQLDNPTPIHKKTGKGKRFLFWLLPGIAVTAVVTVLLYTQANTVAEVTRPAFSLHVPGNDMHPVFQEKQTSSVPVQVAVVIPQTGKKAPVKKTTTVSGPEQPTVHANTPSSRIKNLMSSVALNHKPQNPVIIKNPITHATITDFSSGTGGDKVLLIDRPEDELHGTDISIPEIQPKKVVIPDPKILNEAEKY